jgi:hypothetical protein
VRESIESLRPEQREFLRAVGGLLLTAGTIVLFIRKSSHGAWGDFGRLLVLLIPCVALYALGLGMADKELASKARPGLNSGLFVTAKRVARPWQSVLLVSAVILIPFVLLQFIELVNGNSSDSWNTAWVFLLTAGFALYAAFAAGVGYATLLASLSLLVVWLSVWDKVLDSPSANTFRWLLLVLAVLFVVVAVALERRQLRQAVDFVTGAGIAAVAAGVLGLIGLAIEFAGRSISQAFGSSTPSIGGVQQHQEWDILLLLIGLALVWYGARRAARGPTYVGGIALFAFIVSVGAELVKVFAGGAQPEGSFVGWPLLLLALGVAGLAAGFAASRPASQPAPMDPPQPA